MNTNDSLATPSCRWAIILVKSVYCRDRPRGARLSNGFANGTRKKSGHTEAVVTYQNIGLAVVIDADKSEPGRHTQLDNELQNTGLQKRSPTEQIVIWAPKRNIETWVAFLIGHDVNEDIDCKRLVRSEDYRPPAARFVRLYQQPCDRPDPVLPSPLSSSFALFRR